MFESANAPALSPDKNKGTLPDNSPEINRITPTNEFGNDTMYR